MTNMIGWDTKGRFLPGRIFRGEEGVFKDQLPESGRQKTKEIIVPRGRFHLVENHLNTIFDKTLQQNFDFVTKNFRYDDFLITCRDIKPHLYSTVFTKFSLNSKQHQWKSQLGNYHPRRFQWLFFTQIYSKCYSSYVDHHLIEFCTG